jgi:endonuclease/exonuclease/phosphatase family metal-dependent hydrolase
MAVRRAARQVRAGAREARASARKARASARKARRERAREQRLERPHLSFVRAPTRAGPSRPMGRHIRVATYNVHRWTGLNGRSRPDPAKAGFVISELGADVIALQEVLRPTRGPDPMEDMADTLGLHVAFAAARVHRLGELGNAILSRWPIAGVFVLDLSYSRMERRLAMVAQFHFDGGGILDVVATHLALGDRTRHRQVRSLLDHPRLQAGPTVLLGDLNAWRRCKATRALDDELTTHHNRNWPASFPSARPVLSLDRIYSRGARVVEIATHGTQAARRASDHLPVVARIELPV